MRDRQIRFVPPSRELKRVRPESMAEPHMQVIGLQRWDLILPKTWPTWTMMLQALGSVLLCWEGMQAALPEVRSGDSSWPCWITRQRLQDQSSQAWTPDRRTHYTCVMVLPSSSTCTAGDGRHKWLGFHVSPVAPRWRSCGLLHPLPNHQH